MSYFINLRTLSDYSIGKSVIKIPDLAEYCLQNSIPAIALTDHNNLFGSLEFSLECLKRGIQPIIGCIITVYLQNKEIGNIIGDTIILVKNEIGYRNLIKLMSYYLMSNTKFRISFNDLLNYSQGLIILCGNNNSLIEKLFYRGKIKEAIELTDILLYHLRKNFYLELSRVRNDMNREFDQFIQTLAIKKNIPIVATNPTNYIKQDMYDALDALMCITENSFLIQEDRKKASFNTYLQSYDQMEKLFSDIPEAIENTKLIAKQCTFLLKATNRLLLPNFLSTKEAESQALIKQSYKGLEKRLMNKNSITDKELYFTRLRYELSVITKMEFSGYFLIVSDFIKWSKDQSIAVGPGRGSGAGSIVAWSLQISDIDPIKFGLLFERFLNPERVSMPDFDIDFCQERRDEVIEYVKKKFGDDKVAHIITFGKLQARAALRDVGRVLQIPYLQVDKICKMVPNNPANPVTLREAVSIDKELKAQSQNNLLIKKLISISLKLEGVNRHISTHAAGIVIGNQALTQIVPLYKDLNSTVPMIQYSLKYAEKIGLVKFDFLGLKTLTMIDETCRLIKHHYQELNFDTISLDDTKTYSMLSRGDCIGVFQFESSGMREIIKKIKPDKIDDLIALGSLYRPGPMDNIPSYINRKHGKEKVDYIHPLLEPILKETFGIIVYQEQVMKIAQVLANYSLGEADMLRRAMGKKIKKEMEAQRNKFIEGCIKNTIKKIKAEEIFNLINKFASYGFNKSHAAAYAYISFQTAYLKANYTIEFITSAINLEIDNTEKIYLFLIEAKKFGIEILLPNINNSKAEFIIEDNKIRFGLVGLKGIGKKIIDLIVQEREKNGRYKDIFDLIERSYNIGLNKKVLESLIKSGTLDISSINRNSLLKNIDALLTYSYKNRYNRDQLSLFFNSKSYLESRPQIKQFKEFNKKEKFNAEFESFGFYISEHPITKYKFLIQHLNITESTDIVDTSGYRSKINLIGVLISKKIRSTPKGKYAFLQLCDLKGIIDVSVFDESLLYDNSDILTIGNSLYCIAQLKKKNAGIRIIAQDIKVVDEAIIKSNIIITIVIKNVKQLEDLQQRINYSEGIKINILVEVTSGALVHFKKNNALYVNINDLYYLKTLGMIVRV